MIFMIVYVYVYDFCKLKIDKQWKICAVTHKMYKTWWKMYAKSQNYVRAINAMCICRYLLTRARNNLYINKQTSSQADTFYYSVLHHKNKWHNL